MDKIEKVREIFSQQLNKPVEEITDDKEILKDLGADSLDVVEMLMAMETEFNISIPAEEATGIKTVGDVIKIIESK